RVAHHASRGRRRAVRCPGGGGPAETGRGPGGWGGTARLALWDAEASGTVTTDRGDIRWRSFTATDPSVIVIVLEGRGGERAVAVDWVPAEARPPRKVARKEAFAPEALHPPPTVTRSGAGVTSGQAVRGGGGHAE